MNTKNVKINSELLEAIQKVTDEHNESVETWMERAVMRSLVEEMKDKVYNLYQKGCSLQSIASTMNTTPEALIDLISLGKPAADCESITINYSPVLLQNKIIA